MRVPKCIGNYQIDDISCNACRFQYICQELAEEFEDCDEEEES